MVAFDHTPPPRPLTQRECFDDRLIRDLPDPVRGPHGEVLWDEPPLPSIPDKGPRQLRDVAADMLTWRPSRWRAIP
jgi:hypothetical protein